MLNSSSAETHSCRSLQASLLQLSQPKRLKSNLRIRARSAHMIAIPAEFANRNVVIEISGGGISKTQAYYANSLAVQTMMENFGQLKLSNPEGKPISKAYVKVYAQLNDGRVSILQGWLHTISVVDLTTLRLARTRLIACNALPSW